MEEKEKANETLKSLKLKLANKEKELTAEKDKFKKLEARAIQLRDELER